MDSDDDFDQLPSPIHERKLKRLKKATRVSENPPPSSSPINLSEFANNSELEESNKGSILDLESFGDKIVTDTVEEDDSTAKRVLEFDSVSDELDEKFTEKTPEEFIDLNTEELETKQNPVDDVTEKKENAKNKKKKKNKRIDDGDGSEKKLKESISNKRKAEKVPFGSYALYYQ